MVHPRKPRSSSGKGMGFVERWRAEIVVLIVLPLSLCLWALRVMRRRLFAPTPEGHATRVDVVVAAVTSAAGSLPLRTDRSPYDSHSVRNSDKTRSKRIPLRDLRAILGLSNGLLHCEPGTTVGEATSFLLKRGLQLECTLEMEDATLGGLAMAVGMTTHSHVCGLIHDTIEEYELVTATGQLVTARADNEHAELFLALPWSHGSLGFLVSLKLRTTRAKPYVLLRYVPCKTREELQLRYSRVLAGVERGDSAGADVPFFAEALIFSPSTAVFMEGRLVEREDAPANVRINRCGLWFKPWFFLWVKSKLLRNDAELEELIPIRDYLMRHDRSMCMTMATIIPYGNHWLFRWLLGWLLPPQMSFLKASHTPQTREASVRKQCYQDVAFPEAKLGEAIDLVDELFGIYPLMCYPCRLGERGGGFLRGSGRFLNLGVYGVPAALRADPSAPFDMMTRVRRLEAFVRSVKGFQHTYCDSFQTKEEFGQMFDTATLPVFKRWNCIRPHIHRL